MRSAHSVKPWNANGGATLRTCWRKTCFLLSGKTHSNPSRISIKKSGTIQSWLGIDVWERCKLLLLCFCSGPNLHTLLVKSRMGNAKLTIFDDNLYRSCVPRPFQKDKVWCGEHLAHTFDQSMLRTSGGNHGRRAFVYLYSFCWAAGDLPGGI